MKKVISIALALVLLMTATVSAFALSDTDGTAYETAVDAIVEKGYISGYTDNTYRPEKSLSRAEACSIVAAFTGATTEDMLAAPDAGFNDMDTYKWAKPAVNYAVENGILSGYTDGTFRPAKEVSYAELAVMIVNAMGKADQVTGAWNTGYMAVAEEEGYLKGMISFDSAADLAKPATRGNTAIIVSNADVIREAEKTEDETPAGDKEPGKATPLDDLNGYAYGAINGYSSVLNEDDETVTEIEFVFGDGIQYLKTKKGFDPVAADLKFDGTLYCLKMRNGLVTAIATKDTYLTENMKVGNFQELTTGTSPDAWVWEVTEKDAIEILRVKNGSDELLLDVNSELHSIYVATSGSKDAEASGSAIDGFRAGTFRDIAKGDFVRAYDVTKDDAFADVIFVLKK